MENVQESKHNGISEKQYRCVMAICREQNIKTETSPFSWTGQVATEWINKHGKRNKPQEQQQPERVITEGVNLKHAYNPFVAGMAYKAANDELLSKGVSPSENMARVVSIMQKNYMNCMAGELACLKLHNPEEAP